MSSWGCPHEIDGVCQRVRGALCDPGMCGCVVQGLVEVQGEPRGVGRRQLPSNVLGPLHHAAEHAARHTGRALTTAKFIRGDT